MNNQYKIMGLLMLIVGAGVFIFGIVTLTEYDRMANKSDVVTATITSVEKEFTISDGKRRAVWIPYVDYEYNGVKHHHVQCNHGKEFPHEGDTLPIFVDRKNPENIISSENTNSRIGGGLLIALALFFVFPGLYVYRYQKKTQDPYEVQ